MDAKMKHTLSLLMGIVIILVDLYWTYLAYSLSYGAINVPVDLGIIILIASIVWLWADL